MHVVSPPNLKGATNTGWPDLHVLSCDGELGRWHQASKTVTLRIRITFPAAGSVDSEALKIEKKLLFLRKFVGQHTCIFLIALRPDNPLVRKAAVGGVVDLPWFFPFLISEIGSLFYWRS